MTGAMFVPVVAVIACYWGGTVSATAICPVACSLMTPAMTAAMLLRVDA
jgi:hypothetical protein